MQQVFPSGCCSRRIDMWGFQRQAEQSWGSASGWILEEEQETLVWFLSLGICLDCDANYVFCKDQKGLFYPFCSLCGLT